MKKTPEQINRVCQLHYQGYSLRQISKLTGIPKTSVHRIINGLSIDSSRSSSTTPLSSVHHPYLCFFSSLPLGTLPNSSLSLPILESPTVSIPVLNTNFSPIANLTLSSSPNISLQKNIFENLSQQPQNEEENQQKKKDSCLSQHEHEEKELQKLIEFLREGIDEDISLPTPFDSQPSKFLSHQPKRNQQKRTRKEKKYQQQQEEEEEEQQQQQQQQQKFFVKDNFCGQSLEHVDLWKQNKLFVF